MIGRLSYYVIGTQKKSLYFLLKKKLKKEKEGKRKYSQKKRIRIVVGFITTYAASA
jgi:hypothetical protein